MFESPNITREELEEILFSTGYRIGYEKIVSDVVYYVFVVYYYRNWNVISCKFVHRLLDSVSVCNEGSADHNEAFNIFNLTKQDVLLEIRQRAETDYFKKPAILASFTDIIFKSYDDSDSKYKKYVSELEFFEPDFREIYNEEFESLKPVGTPSVVVRPFDCFIDNDQVYWYVAESCNSTYLLRPVIKDNRLTEGRLVEIRELMNQSVYRQAGLNEACADLSEGLFGVLSCFRDWIDGSLKDVYGVTLPVMPDCIQRNLREPVITFNDDTFLMEFFIPMPGRMVKVYGDCAVSGFSFLDDNHVGKYKHGLRKLRETLADKPAVYISGMFKELRKEFLPVLHLLGVEGWLNDLINRYLDADVESGHKPETVSIGSSSQFSEKPVRKIEVFGTGEPDLTDALVDSADEFPEDEFSLEIMQ